VPQPLTSIRRLDNLLSVVAAVLLPLGVLVIGIGWYGAAHTPYLFEQVPYLISGGLIGVALVIGSGLFYFGSWIARGASAQQQASAELADLLTQIRDELAARPATPAPRTRKEAKETNGHSSFVATAHGSMLHRPDCSVVVGRNDLHSVPADGSGLQPCGLCEPLASDARNVHVV
jgi:uncharacterized membrane protein YedE/YeeE